MTKVIGLMCVRDEADLLVEVYPHIKGLVDEIYAYDDGSQDGTWDIIKDSDYAMRKVDDNNRQGEHRPNYNHLLEKIKENHDLDKEDVWVVLTMGDRFFLNKTPRQIVEEAKAEGFPCVEGIQLDFLRHRLDPWTPENDTWPDYGESLRKICRWVRVDEFCIVAYKVTNECSYLNSKYPWAKPIGMPQYRREDMEDKISLDMPFLEHQGRRSPHAAMKRLESGARWLGQKYKNYDYSTFATTVRCNRRMYEAYRLYPWMGLESLVPIINWWNHKPWHNRVSQRWFFKGVEAAWELTKLPERTDI